MFSIFTPIKKLLGFKKKSLPKIKEEKPNVSLDQRVNNLSKFFQNFFAYCIIEFRIIKEKLQNLSTTNYELGMKHLEEGNVDEAVFRFKITKKIWSEHYESYYQLIYCLILLEKFDEAQEIIDDLLNKNPAYQEKINHLLSTDPIPETELELLPKNKTNQEGASISENL